MKFLDVPQSGSIAGTTHSHNRAGQYTRNRRSPVQPVGTGRRAAVRAAFAAASAGWAGLTDPQRAAWSSFADSHPITDSLGQSVILTGHQMYVRVNATLANVSQVARTAPPSDLDLPDLSPSSLVVDISSGIVVDDFVGTAGQFVVVAVSRPFSAGRSFNKTFWQPPGTTGWVDGATPPFTLAAAAYNAQFGAPVAGQRVFVRLTPVSTEGWNGAPVIMSGIAVP